MMKHEEVRQQIRQGVWTGPTAGLAPDYMQANLVILPKKYAFDFLLFCMRNKKACPLLEVTDPGSPVPQKMAPSADLRTDVPRYRIYKHGELTDEVTDLKDHWTDDAVSFLIGCSFTFEAPLLDAGVPIRHIETGCNVPMYTTSISCEPAGFFSGPMVVSMRPMKPQDMIRAVEITAQYPDFHGAPVHAGDPSAIGIADLNQPDFGDAVPVRPGEIPVFWACGVTPQAVALASKPEWMITHAPGHMFITDQKTK